MTKRKDICWLVWSIDHSAWWAYNSRGYTTDIDNAGRYTFKEAHIICEQANITGLHEFMVPSPELVEDMKKIIMPDKLTSEPAPVAVPYPNVTKPVCDFCDEDLTGKDVYYHIYRAHDLELYDQRRVRKTFEQAYCYEMNEIARRKAQVNQ